MLFIYSSKGSFQVPRNYLQCWDQGGSPWSAWPAHTRVLQLSYRAREIFSKFLCSKATTPVNIDSQAQLADDILSAPHPDMFKEQQLQVTSCFRFLQGHWPGRGVEDSGPRQWAPKYPGWEGRSQSVWMGWKEPVFPAGLRGHLQMPVRSLSAVRLCELRLAVLCAQRGQMVTAMSTECVLV